MSGPKCTVCANPVVRNALDPLLAEKMTGAGVSRYLADAGINVSSEVVNRHRQHYAPPPEKEKGTRKRDFAVLVRDKAYEKFEGEDLDLANKDHVAGINAGLKAQGIIDKREQAKSQKGGADLAFAIIAMLRGEAPAPLALPDPSVIEGEFEEVSVETD